MAPHDLRRPFKRAAISDQQRRRELSLQRQAQHRRDAQHQARCLASFLNPHSEPEPETEPEPEPTDSPKELDIRHASKLKGAEARKWFARQLMLPEWMIDVPDQLPQDWYVFARPAGKRCFVVSSNGTTVSRLRNGSMLHHFPSALPSGARTKDSSGSAQSYSILDCIFHESDQTYYVIDMVCWREYSLYDCTAEFRFFWLSSKLVETGACDPPSQYHRYRFSPVPVYNCDQAGLSAAYTGAVPYVKDGLLFYNKYQEAFVHFNSPNGRAGGSRFQDQGLGGHWELIIKIAGVRKKRVKRSAYFYEALNSQGTTVFRGCHSSAANSAYGALMEAMVEAAVQAMRCGFRQLLFISSSKMLVHHFSRASNPNWKEKTTFADLSSLKQLGLVFKYLFVPSVVLNNVYSLAVLATNSPVHYNWTMLPNV